MKQKVSKQVPWILHKLPLRQKGHRPDQEFLRDKKRSGASNDLAEREQAFQKETYLKRDVYALLIG